MTVDLLHRLLRRDDIDREAQHVSVVATPAEREAIAVAFDLVALDRLEADLNARSIHRGAGVRVEGRLCAEVTQTCVVTLEPVQAIIDLPVAVIYLETYLIEEPEEEGEDFLLDLDAEDVLPMEGRMIDVGRLTLEEFSLALNPHPRAPGARLNPDDTPRAGAPESPFATLARFRQIGRDEG